MQRLRTDLHSLLARKQGGIVARMSQTTGPSGVRIAPTGPGDRSPDQRRLLESVRGDDAANVFATLVEHPQLFEAWLPFCLYLLRCPELGARRREMVILRTAYRCGAHYEWAHHAGFALKAGLSEDEIQALSSDSDAGWSSEERALVGAVDELHDQHSVADATWRQLVEFLETKQLIALLMLVGQYMLLAGALNALGVAIDDDLPASQRSPGWRER
jgi:4-carboxymuconolactone decarboxylase